MAVFNCECTGTNPSRNLMDLRTELMVRLGFSAMVDNPPPGMEALLTSFLQSAQVNLYRQYDVLRTERFFEWNLVAGERFYDVEDGGGSECDKVLDPRKLTWVGVELNGLWYPMIEGIRPEVYTLVESTGLPAYYEIRQCIEIFPAPDTTGDYTMRIKGRFGLERFVDDYDQCTIDDEAVFLYALARAKAHYTQPDAANYQRDCMTYIGNMTAGAHGTKRYIPGNVGLWIEPNPIYIPLP